jgi:uncharacterized membrane protein
MRGILEFLKTTLAGGFFVVLPVVLIWLILTETIQLLAALGSPLLELFPSGFLGESPGPTLAIILLVLACFIAGLAMRTQLGTWLGQRAEERVLARIPGYSVLRNISRALSGSVTDLSFTPALIVVSDGVRKLGFIVETHDDDHLTVFVPLTSAPAMGDVYVVRRDRVQALEATLTQALDPISHFGVGTMELLTATRSGGAAPPPGR